MSNFIMILYYFLNNIRGECKAFGDIKVQGTFPQFLKSC